MVAFKDILIVEDSQVLRESLFEQLVAIKNVNVNPDKYQGYAFGIGIDRLAMLKYGINDLRALFETDYRWLNHFGFDPLDVPSNYRGLSR